MIESKGARLRALHQRPVIGDARPIFANLVAFEEDGSVRKLLAGRGTQDFGEPFLSGHFHDQSTSRTEASPDILQDAALLVGILKIAEGRKHAERKIERVWASEIAHVLLDPFDCRGSFISPLSGTLQ